MSLQVSVHHNCRWSGPERFHIRVSMEDALIQAFMEKVVYYAESDLHEFFDVGGWFEHNGLKFKLDEGEFGSGAVIDPKVSDIAFAGITVDNAYLTLTPYQGGWNIDFSLEKVYGDDRDLDHMKWLDTGVEEDLPECFWVEPAAIIRAIIRH